MEQVMYVPKHGIRFTPAIEREVSMKNSIWTGVKKAGLLAATLAALQASPAFAGWLFEGGEGFSYAYATDGGFVDGSYQNGLMFFCPDDGNPCEFRVTVNGAMPQPMVVVSFVFSDGKTVQRRAEEINGGVPQIGWQDGLMEELLSQDSVTVSIADGTSHTFSLTGSSKAINRAMNR
jgi:hypothetical protein